MRTLIHILIIWWLRYRINSRKRTIDDLEDYLSNHSRASRHYDAEVSAHVAELVELNRLDQCRIAAL